MTDEQITMLRRLIKDEIECAQIDGFEHGQWGWAEKQLDDGWKAFQKSSMTETDISKVLIEGDYATIMGVKYKRVEDQ